MNPHLKEKVIRRGTPLKDSKAIVILVHGRGQTAETMFELIERMNLTDTHYILPQAADNSWYPYGFMKTLSENEPYLSYSLECYQNWLNELFEQNISPKMIVLLGFSQGACLTAEYAVRNPQRYGGIILLTGGVIGPEGTSWEKNGSFDGTPVFLGSSDVDEWVPEKRVHESADIFLEMGGNVIKRIYKGRDHVVNDDEISFARKIIQNIM